MTVSVFVIRKTYYYKRGFSSKSDGLIGFMTRGLKTKILINGIQSSMFVLIYDKLCSGSKSYLRFAEEFLKQENIMDSAA